jgi:FkbM family methyltransferase
MGSGQLEIAGYRREHGLLWPDYDTRCAQVTFRETADNIARADRHTPTARRRVAVQAGGNCGQLVRGLAEMFGQVYTFEPDERNFVALVVNTAEHRNVHRFQAALDVQRGLGISLGNGDAAYPGANCGALYVEGSGPTRTMRIDDLDLIWCDLIYLDVEGGELRALAGAEMTIRRCKPVIIFENKGNGAKFYGEEPDAAERWLELVCGYQVVERGHLDTVMVQAP